MNILHSSRTDRWFTPEYLIEMAKAVLGDIDLDPASEELANRAIQAKTIITQERDGLTTEWSEGSIFLNPPGGKLKNRSLSALFWAKLMDHKQNCKLTHAIYIGFSLEQLAISQSYHELKMLDFPLCVPRKRIKFDNPVVAKHAPSHSNVIIYVPGAVDKTDLFLETFSTIGACKR